MRAWRGIFDLASIAVSRMHEKRQQSFLKRLDDHIGKKEIKEVRADVRQFLTLVTVSPPSTPVTDPKI